MNIIVLEESRPKKERGLDRNDPEIHIDGIHEDKVYVPPHVIKWWLPFKCGKVGTIHTNNGQIGMGCGSRACLKCHRKKLSKSVQSIMHIKRYPKTSMYSLVFTPKERVKSHDDVSNFLSDFRGLLKKWQRTHGLKYGYWVAETVIKDDEPVTDIICPVRAWNNPDSDNDITNDIYERCTTHGTCPICKGKGYLPSTHLHIHLVVCCPSFYFGEGETPQHLKQRNFYDFNGRGFYGFCEDNNMGVSKCQLMKSRKDMTDYISKACLVYISKVQGDKDDKGVIDWEETQRSVMIASFTYGRKRHRGACGDAYGITTTTKDYTNFVTFRYEPPQQIEPNSTDFFRGHRPTKDPQKKQMNGGRYIDVMTIGIKAQKTIQGVEDLNNVLKETKLDMYDDCGIGSTYIYHYGRVEGSSYITECKYLSSETLSSKWAKTPVVTKTQLWFRLTKEYFIFGRGSTMLSVPVEWYYLGGWEYLHWLMGHIYWYSYDDWHTLLQYPFDD